MTTEIRAHIAGTVWKILKKVGDAVESGEPVAILESMKMELPVESPIAGTVQTVHCTEGQSVQQGDGLFSISESA